MGMMGNFLRRARIRGLKEGKVQTGRVEMLENDAKDAAERWQDYGFSAQPIDGQGLVINAGGHTIILRMDRIAERPTLAAYEVSVWHKEGHSVTLKAGRVVQVDCDDYIVNAKTYQVNASARVSLTSPVTNVSAVLNVAGAAAFTGASITHAGKSIGGGHTHSGVQTGPGTTGAPV